MTDPQNADHNLSEEQPDACERLLEKLTHVIIQQAQKERLEPVEIIAVAQELLIKSVCFQTKNEPEKIAINLIRAMEMPATLDMIKMYCRRRDLILETVQGAPK